MPTRSARTNASGKLSMNSVSGKALRRSATSASVVPSTPEHPHRPTIGSRGPESDAAEDHRETRERHVPVPPEHEHLGLDARVFGVIDHGGEDTRTESPFRPPVLPPFL